MVMATRTFHSQAKEYRSKGGGLVVGIDHAIFLIGDPPLNGVAMIAIETGCDKLTLRRLIH